MFSSNTSAVSGDAVYIEDVFSTWLYTGNGSTQTITNGIDLSTKGGLVWVKSRSNVSRPELVDSARGTNSALYTNGSDAAGSNPSVYNLLSTGFQVGVGSGWGNESGYTYASWTFRKQPKFFDVVTYTGNGANNRQISHSLGSAPGFIIVKNVTNSQSWICYHRSLGTGNFIILNGTGASSADANAFPTVTSTFFVPTADQTAFALNTSGDTFVAYLFAHDAGGFGLTGTDNVISCGSFQDNGSGTNLDVNLGYEPQWLLVKAVDGLGSWLQVDSMRGFVANPGTTTSRLIPNLSNSEAPWNIVWGPTATGFQWNQNSGRLYIYIAIRRGPMKTPTTGTSVFKPQFGTSGTPSITTPFVVDSVFDGYPSGGFYGSQGVTARLTGNKALATASTAAEDSTYSSYWTYDYSNGAFNNINNSHILWAFGRAPGFFDVVCYTGTGVNRTVTHNLGVAPELMIIKARSSGGYGWPVYAAAPGPTKFAYLDDTGGFSANSTAWNDTAPTASVFTVGTGSLMNTSSVTYVAYLFASVAGVSKVGSYTGTGTTLQIDCGFTGGARFVLIKRTDSTGDWYVWDSARGIVSGNDPYLLLNSTAAEVTSTDYIDTYSAGFEISSTAPAAINANGGSFVFLAIA